MNMLNFFKKTKDIAIDLNSENIVIVHNGNVVINEPSVVAIEGNKLLAVGKEAERMEADHPKDVRILYPLSDNVICDFTATENLIRGVLCKAFGSCGTWGQKFNMLIVVPTGITEVEKCAIRDIACHAGARTVRMIFAPLATAIGLGIDIEKPDGELVIDVGASTTDLTTISLFGIVESTTIRNTSSREETMKKVGQAILDILAKTPPELRNDILQSGPYLVGKAPLFMIAKGFPTNFSLNFHTVEDRDTIAATGADIALQDLKKYPCIMI